MFRPVAFALLVAAVAAKPSSYATKYCEAPAVGKSYMNMPAVEAPIETTILFYAKDDALKTPVTTLAVGEHTLEVGNAGTSKFLVHSSTSTATSNMILPLLMDAATCASLGGNDVSGATTVSVTITDPSVETTFTIGVSTGFSGAVGVKSLVIAAAADASSSTGAAEPSSSSSTGAADSATGASSSTGAADSSTGAAASSTGAAASSTGAADSSTGAADSSTGASSVTDAPTPQPTSHPTVVQPTIRPTTVGGSHSPTVLYTHPTVSPTGAPTAPTPVPPTAAADPSSASAGASAGATLFLAAAASLAFVAL